MQPIETASRSLLDKPLHQLTEDDISQLTREDCRKYLKEKGMRRPSWNKSQAIQQVISLKTLLETTSDSDVPAVRKRLYIPPVPENPVKETSADTRCSVPAGEESVPYRQPDRPKVHFLGDPLVGVTASDNDSVSPRTTGAVDESGGQMTIFYCGKVNVYDGIPKDKAQAIMQLAASPHLFPQDASSNVSAAFRAFPCQLESGRTASNSPMLAHLTTQKEGPTNRKASVQRYLEKRKDRFKNKRKVAMPSSTGLDICFNHMVGDDVSNEQWNQSEDWPSPQPKPPETPTRCSSVENVKGNKVCFRSCF
ncbi:hypothetical protein K2173_025678 [Erythroxylum novogranatense]|uniref:Protein TIFY n=1 Tax=Erythroxylum novogranatense TaxID=1862640 RepID=A0AAV8SBP9_9ROSI|nr:hypothetical protein K2173_025678 [Erythroxylum novogranatense]